MACVYTLYFISLIRGPRCSRHQFGPHRSGYVQPLAPATISGLECLAMRKGTWPELRTETHSNPAVEMRTETRRLFYELQASKIAVASALEYKRHQSGVNWSIDSARESLKARSFTTTKHNMVVPG